jgi:hypothetical protein
MRFPPEIASGKSIEATLVSEEQNSARDQAAFATPEVFPGGIEIARQKSFALLRFRVTINAPQKSGV